MLGIYDRHKTGTLVWSMGFCPYLTNREHAPLADVVCLATPRAGASRCFGTRLRCRAPTSSVQKSNLIRLCQIYGQPGPVVLVPRNDLSQVSAKSTLCIRRTWFVRSDWHRQRASVTIFLFILPQESTLAREWTKAIITDPNAGYRHRRYTSRQERPGQISPRSI
jgi:hypothetical protein